MRTQTPNQSNTYNLSSKWTFRFLEPLISENNFFHFGSLAGATTSNHDSKCPIDSNRGKKRNTGLLNGIKMLEQEVETKNYYYFCMNTEGFGEAVTVSVLQPGIQQCASLALGPHLSPLWCQLGFLTPHARKPQGLGPHSASKNSYTHADTRTTNVK